MERDPEGKTFPNLKQHYDSLLLNGRSGANYVAAYESLINLLSVAKKQLDSGSLTSIVQGWYEKKGFRDYAEASS